MATPASVRRTSGSIYVPDDYPVPLLAGLGWRVAYVRLLRRKRCTSRVTLHSLRQWSLPTGCILKNKADLPVPQDGSLRFAHGAYGYAIQQIFAAGGSI